MISASQSGLKTIRGVYCVKINTKKICDCIHDVYSKRNAEEIQQTTNLKKIDIKINENQEETLIPG